MQREKRIHGLGSFLPFSAACMIGWSQPFADMRREGDATGVTYARSANHVADGAVYLGTSTFSDAVYFPVSYERAFIPL